MKDLYPEIRPYRSQQLKVDDIHTLYLEEVGDPDGLPALFLHGGPGVGITPNYSRFFDPEHYRIVLVDQRGAGRSTPHARAGRSRGRRGQAGNTLGDRSIAGATPGRWWTLPRSAALRRSSH